MASYLNLTKEPIRIHGKNKTKRARLAVNFMLVRMFSFPVLMILSLILSHSNLTDRHIKSLEFNVLDSLNTKLIRPVSTTCY